jgi:hypothetical protein
VGKAAIDRGAGNTNLRLLSVRYRAQRENERGGPKTAPALPLMVREDIGNLPLRAEVMS